MAYLKNLRQDKAFRVTIWTIVSAIVSALIAWIATLDIGATALLTLIIRELMKYINVKYFGDIGVDK